MEFDLEYPLGNLEGKQEQDSSFSQILALESDHMPIHQYLSYRGEAISLISQLQSSCNLDPFVSYLAVNYMDRFLFRHEIEQGKPWLPRLIIISCLSLASKMTNTPFSLTHLQQQIEGCNIIDAQNVGRMELLILGALKWRMRSITPFSFLHIFISLAELDLKVKDPSFKQSLKQRASQIIFNAQDDIRYLGFKPSVVAASALISASNELSPLKIFPVRASIRACGYVDEEAVSRCFNLMVERERIQALQRAST